MADSYLKPGFFTRRVFNPIVAFLAEVADGDKAPILRAYLEEWAWEVGRFFAGIGADAPDADLARIAARHPVFRIVR